MERKLTYYTSIKDALKNKSESGFEPGSVATSLNDRLSSNIKALTSAQTILRWTEEALTAIKAILRVDIKNLLEDKEGVLQEATNWKNQSATRQLGLEEIDSLERDMLDYVKGQLLTVIDLAGQICQKIEDNTDTPIMIPRWIQLIMMMPMKMNTIEDTTEDIPIIIPRWIPLKIPQIYQ